MARLQTPRHQSRVELTRHLLLNRIRQRAIFRAGDISTRDSVGPGLEGGWGGKDDSRGVRDLFGVELCLLAGRLLNLLGELSARRPLFYLPV